MGLIWLDCGHLLWFNCIGILVLLLLISQYSQFLSTWGRISKSLNWISLEMSVLMLYRMNNFTVSNENIIFFYFFFSSVILWKLLGIFECNWHLSLRKKYFACMSSFAALSRISQGQLISIYIWIIWTILLLSIFRDDWRLRHNCRHYCLCASEAPFWALLFWFCVS